MNRRSFMTLASGLLVPWEPERVYSFLPAWRLMPRKAFECLAAGPLVVLPDQCPDKFYDFGAIGLATGARAINPANLLDVQKSADAYGSELNFIDAPDFFIAESSWERYRRVQEFYGHIYEKELS